MLSQYVVQRQHPWSMVLYLIFDHLGEKEHPMLAHICWARGFGFPVDVIGLEEIGIGEERVVRCPRRSILRDKFAGCCSVLFITFALM
jgi:hypothetical protein